MVEKLPVRKKVAEVLVSRYGPGKRPTSWDDRRAGIECVRTTDGEVLLLKSSGQQSSPAPFWELLLTDSATVDDKETPKLASETLSSNQAFSWTLYGIGKGAPLPEVKQ